MSRKMLLMFICFWLVLLGLVSEARAMAPRGTEPSEVAVGMQEQRKKYEKNFYGSGRYTQAERIRRQQMIVAAEKKIMEEKVISRTSPDKDLEEKAAARQRALSVFLRIILPVAGIGGVAFAIYKTGDQQFLTLDRRQMDRRQTQRRKA